MTKDSSPPVGTTETFQLALTFARALGALITVLRAVAPDRSAVTQQHEVRRSLRATAAAARSTALELRLVDGRLRLGGQELAPDSPHRDDALNALVGGLTAHGSLALDVRRGAAPSELLELARLLSTDRGTVGDRRVWRSWSVRITPESSAVVVDTAPVPEAVQHELARLRAARDDATMRDVIQALLRLLRTPPWARDPVVVEAIALGMVQDARERGNRGGRLALEAGIRQLLTTDTLTALVARLSHTTRSGELIPVLARGADVSVSALVQTLQDADTIAARRICFDAIVALDAGEEVLRDALHDPRWFVVRNAAALLGEMGVVDSDTYLAELLSHADDRIRVAGARALTRLGTDRALTALQQSLTDPSPELRRLAAAAHGGLSQSKPSTAELLSALDIETDEDVMLEIVSVLGALGSPDGVQRLLRLLRSEADEADPWLREAAYSALVAARGRGVAKLLAQP